MDLYDISRSATVPFLPYSGKHPQITSRDIKLGHEFWTEHSKLSDSITEDGLHKRGRAHILKISGNLYLLHQVIHSAHYTTIHIVQNIITGHWYALKKITHNDPETLTLNFTKEVTYLSMLDALIDQFYDRGQNQAYIVMILQPGISMKQIKQGTKQSFFLSLFRKRTKAVTTPFIWLSRFILLMQAVQQLHQKRIIHGDLREKNILCDADEHIYLIDFGLAHRLSKNDIKFAMFATEEVSRRYRLIAPEIMTHGIINEKTEICRLGILIAELLNIAIKTKEGLFFIKDVNTIPGWPDQLANKLIKFLKCMSQTDFNQRPDLKTTIHYLKKLRSECMPTERPLVNIGIVHLDDLLQGASLQHVLTRPLPEAWYQPLLAFDKIYMIFPTAYQSYQEILLNKFKAEAVPVDGSFLADQTSSNNHLNWMLLKEMLSIIQRELKGLGHRTYYYLSNKDGCLRLSHNISG